MKSLIDKYRGYSPKVFFFIAAIFLAGGVSAVFHTTFHNYLNDLFSIGADQRGMLEFPRELPGLLAIFIIGAIFFLGEFNILAMALFSIGAGLFGLGFLSPNIPTMIIFLMLWSTGAHVHMSLIEPAALSLSKTDNKGYVLGKVNAMRSLGIIMGTAAIWFFMGPLKTGYSPIYLVCLIITMVGALLYLMAKEKSKLKVKPSFIMVIKKRYTLFYILSALFGVRKQLFLVFGPWLLIKLFKQQPSDLAKLLLIAAVLGIFLKPLLGKLIDRFGERKVLFVDALFIIVISLIYALTPLVVKGFTALIILYSCYIIDELLFSLRTARTTYLYKILEDKKDLTPTISMGISIEHIVSMTAPAVVGILWEKFEFYWVFIIAALVALVTAGFSLMIPAKSKLEKAA